MMWAEITVEQITIFVLVVAMFWIGFGFGYHISNEDNKEKS